MTGLTLRISSTGKNKGKATTTFDPVLIPQDVAVILSKKNEFFERFVGSSVEVQLALLRDLSYQTFSEDFREADAMEFLAIVYLNAESKHPVQCFVLRYIMKKEPLHRPFTEALIAQIRLALAAEHSSYTSYRYAVGQLCSCIDNLPGANTIQALEAVLAEYLRDCLQCCVDTIRDNTLAPTNKNDIFGLIHTTFRVLLFIVQKLSEERQANLDHVFEPVESSIVQILRHDDAPMDTKSVGGILYVTLYVMKNGPDSWIEIIQPAADSKVRQVMTQETAQLSLLGGVCTVVPAAALYSTAIQGQPAILILTRDILSVGERMSSDTVVLLGVTRSLAQISKSLSTGGGALVGLLLPFVWAHLEHYLDSVGHLCASALQNIVQYCAHLYKKGDNEALDQLFSALAELDRGRKSFYLCVAALGRQIGTTAVMARLPSVMIDCIHALSVQAVQASATNCLETLLRSHVREVRRAELHRTWVEPIIAYITSATLPAAALNVLQQLLVQAVALDADLIDYIMVPVRRVCGCPDLSGDELKCALTILSVARKCGALNEAVADEERWKDIISYDVLRRAAVDALDENRILSLSLIVECPKSTEAFTARELQYVIWFLSNNCNAQAPSFRQTTLSVVKKLINRLDDSYAALVRDRLPVEHYEQFLKELRALCFYNLLPGANYSRRHAALQTLLWSERVRAHRVWTEEYVDVVLRHLEDSYENNKVLALDLLFRCPEDMLKKKYSTSLEFEDVIAQASSLKPSECVSAAYKMDLLMYRLPENIPPAPDCPRRHAVRWRAVFFTLQHAQRQLMQLRRSLLHAARDAPLHGVLHVLRRLLHIRPGELSILGVLSCYPKWKMVVEEIIDLCVGVNDAVACVVNSASPEGHLPMDTTILGQETDGNVSLSDGRHVTAQMVLLCAWRSVKEVSLILGLIGANYRRDVDEPGTLSIDRIKEIGAHFTALLARLKHRGAFEQAYVGFTTMLAGLWSQPWPELRALPSAWLAELMDSIASGADPRLCATRRSAGLPYMIQALVTTELQSGGGRCFHACVKRLLQLAEEAEEEDTRVHCCNVLRALFRCAALRDQLPQHAPAALRLALSAARAHSWSERNSSTLLFSALMVWIFGVQRSKDAEQLCTRNRMTGRIFFLRFPQLYDYMLNALERAGPESDLEGGELVPVLLLLARLYPSALEGTVSNFKVSSFVPLVRRVGRSAVLHTRRLAARALLPLLAPNEYLPMIQELLESICDPGISTNACHGILLQLIKLFDGAGQLNIEDKSHRRLAGLLRDSGWVLRQGTGAAPCYMLVDDYFKMMNCVLWRFPSLLTDDYIKEIENHIINLLFVCEKQRYHPGMQLCLAHATYLYLVIAHANNRYSELIAFIRQALTNDAYEVVLAVLNYLLIVYEKLDVENKFQEHLQVLCKRSDTKIKLEREMFEDMCEILKRNRYLECQQKALHVLTLQEGTQNYIIRGKTSDVDITEGVAVDKLIEFVETEHESFTRHYLQSLCDFVSNGILKRNINDSKLLETIRVIFACSSSENNEDTRAVVVQFMENSFKDLFESNWSQLQEDEKFELKATLYSTIVMMLEDEDSSLRQRTSSVVATLLSTETVTPARTATLLRAHIACEVHAVALLTSLALLDFRSVVQLTDDVNNECRVFDQNERYNAFFEETIWTRACVEEIKRITTPLGEPAAFIHAISTNSTYGAALARLCGSNMGGIISLCGCSAGEALGASTDVEFNPKLKIFVDTFIK